jgi:hypothetical protein
VEIRVGSPAFDENKRFSRNAGAMRKFFLCPTKSIARGPNIVCKSELQLYSRVVKIFNRIHNVDPLSA